MPRFIPLTQTKIMIQIPMGTHTFILNIRRILY